MHPLAAGSKQQHPINAAPIQVTREPRHAPHGHHRPARHTLRHGLQLPRRVIQRQRPWRLPADHIPITHLRRIPRRHQPQAHHHCQRQRNHDGRAHSPSAPHHARNQPHAKSHEHQKHAPRQHPIHHPQPAPLREIEEHRPVENRRRTPRHHEPREGSSDARTHPHPAQRQTNERQPRPADEPPKLGKERDVRADHRADLRDAVQQKSRGERPRIAEPHTIRIRDEELQPCEPDPRPVQNRTVQRKARPHPPQSHSHQRNRQPPAPVGRARRARRTSARNPPPRANLQSHHEQSRP